MEEKKQYAKPEIVEMDSKIASVAGNEFSTTFGDNNSNEGAI